MQSWVAGGREAKLHSVLHLELGGLSCVAGTLACTKQNTRMSGDHGFEVDGLFASWSKSDASGSSKHLRMVSNQI